MRLRRKNVKKLASLSALGAGAVAWGVQPADASTIVYSGPVNAQVGFDRGFSASYLSPVLGLSGAKFGFKTSSSLFNNFFHRSVYASRGGGVLNFAKGSSTLRVFNAGAKWSSSTTSGGAALVAKRRWNLTTASSTGLGSFANKYALIKFNSGLGTDYGWILLSLSVTGAVSASGTDGPNLTILSYAYDTSGALIAAGDTGIAAVPEPGAFALTGLGALALGAAGLRRWRAALKTA
jgi:hypothetical protein